MTLVGLAARKLSLKKRNAKLATAFPNGVRCQKCLEMGHWSYECKQKRKFVHRTSRTKQLNKRLAEKAAAAVDDGGSGELNDALAKNTTKQSKAKRAKRGNTSSSGGDSSGSGSSDSSSSDSGSSDSDDDSSDSSGSSDSESSSGSDSDSSSSSSESSEDGGKTAATKKVSPQSSDTSVLSSDEDDNP